MNDWADTFPEMKQVHSTRDFRIFQTAWKKEPDTQQNHGILKGVKTKKYFACIVGGSCYGVDVFRQMAVDARAECEEALQRVQQACDFYDENGYWPPDPI